MASQIKPASLNGHVGAFYGVSDNDSYFRQIVHDDTEPEFAKIVNAVVPSDGVCLDIGANIGLKTFILSKHILKGKVYAIEAAKKVVEVLQMNISVNNLDNVQVDSCAVSDYTGSTSFMDCSAWGHILMPDGKNTPRDGDVSVYTVADLCKKHKIERLDFIKIDTEGNELNVLRGAKSILEHFTPWILLEFNAFCLAAYGRVNPLSLLQYIFENFKYVFRVEKSGSLLKIKTKQDILTMLHENIISNGSVDDLLITNKSDALDRAGKLLVDVTDLESDDLKGKCQEVQKKYDELQKQYGALSNSKIFRYSAPLRKIYHRLKK